MGEIEPIAMLAAKKVFTKANFRHGKEAVVKEIGLGKWRLDSALS